MSKRLLRVLSLVLGLALLAGACASANADNPSSNDASDVSCSDIDRVQADVDNQLDEARKEAEDKKGTPDSQKAKDEVTRLETRLDALNRREEQCRKREEERVTSSSSTTTTTAASTESETNVEVIEQDGQKRSLPLVDDNGTPILGDSTQDTRAPATYEDAKNRGPVKDWQEFIDRMGGFSWYVDGLNARKSKTGFDWNDIEKWALLTDIDPRVIHVFRMDLTDQQARDAVRPLIGDDVDRLPVTRHSEFCFENTRGFGRERMQDFCDNRQMVRVALAPIVFDANGQAVGLRRDAGVFVDCLNVFWIPKKVIPPTPQPTPTPTTPPQERPPTTAPPVTSPPVTNPPGPPTTPTTPTTVFYPKPVPPVTAPPPPVTVAPPTTAPPGNDGQHDSGDGETNTVPPPTTVAPAPAPPVTSPPVTNPPGPPAP